MPEKFADEASVMRRAIELAAQGRGTVEPNPPVGAVIVDEHRNLIGAGYHQQYGGPHAEVHALADAGPRAAGATMFVTLEPCCHHGKTPPCSQAILEAGLKRVVVAVEDPHPHISGGGIAELRQAGIAVEIGLLEAEARRLAAPFLKLVTSGLPYVHAKWAMTLDGKLASQTGNSQWISNPSSRAIVHRLRGRMDAILVGAGTARADDPLLTVRPPGPRTPVRIVVDRNASLPADSQLVRTLAEAPVLVAAAEGCPSENVERLESVGVEVVLTPIQKDGNPDLAALLRELGKREMTNVLVEGGSRLLGSCFDHRLIDEVHVFVAPKLVGGAGALTPIGGIGLPEIPQAAQLDQPEIELVDGDIYIHAPLIPAPQ